MCVCVCGCSLKSGADWKRKRQWSLAVCAEYLLYCLNGWVVERNRLANVVWQLNNQEVSTEATGQAENRLGDWPLGRSTHSPPPAPPLVERRLSFVRHCADSLQSFGLLSSVELASGYWKNSPVITLSVETACVLRRSNDNEIMKTRKKVQFLFFFGNFFNVQASPSESSATWSPVDQPTLPVPSGFFFHFHF